MTDRSILDLLPQEPEIFLVGPESLSGAEIGERVEQRRFELGDRTGTQMVIAPQWTTESVIDLYAIPASGAQMVVVDPTLQPEQRRARLSTAAAAVGHAGDLIVFTSGTTGPPKAVRLTIDNLVAAADASIDHLGMTADDVWLGSLPLHHIGGLMVLYRMGRAGGRVALDSGLDLSRTTLVSVVPTILRRLLDAGADSGSTRAVLVGGGPLPPGIIEEAHERGIPALPTYGMTETCAQVATLRPGSPPIHAADPVPGVDLQIGRDGRIMVRGPQISPGYAGRPDREPTDWFITPDIGHLEDGRLVVDGRADDVIVSGGENVNPLVVEQAVANHPGVVEIVVIGVPDREWGEMVVAFFVGEAEEGQLRDYSGLRLSPHEIPKRWIRLEEIPMIGPGKPDRAALREHISRLSPRRGEYRAKRRGGGRDPNPRLPPPPRHD